MILADNIGLDCPLPRQLEPSEARGNGGRSARIRARSQG